MRNINEGLETVEIGLLKHHPRNANIGDVEAIKRSLAVNGWYGSVVVNKRTQHILAGNHRVMAARALGWESVPVTYVDVDEKQELRILMADNRTTRLGQDDDTKIADILSELATSDNGLDGTGYSASDLDALIGNIAGPEERIVGEISPQGRKDWINQDVRSIVLYYAMERYEIVIKAFTDYMEMHDMADFAEVVEHLLGIEVIDGDIEDNEETD